jgi:two-component system, LytTR family, sensor kinase
MLPPGTTEVRVKLKNLIKRRAEPTRPLFMHPAIFLSGWVVLGLLFGLQELMEMSASDEKYPLWTPFASWTIDFLLWGLICLCLWQFLRTSIQNANWKQILLQYLPLSVLVSVTVEATYSAIAPYWHKQMHGPYLTRVGHYLASDMVTDVAMFWMVFALFRGIGYYQRLREQERTAARLEGQLIQAQLQALQMQLNPHFLFNTLNGVSSLMRSDPDGADEMLERLSSLLRITLTKGQAQKIRLQEEMEVVQLYVSIQQLRFGDRVSHSIEVAPEAWDALVPTMILQPILENAYVHGISRSLAQGRISIQASVERNALWISIRNAGCGPTPFNRAEGQGVGIANVKARLQLHYGDRQSFTIREAAPGDVTAQFRLPIEIDKSPSSDNAESWYAASNSDRG